MSFYIYTLGCKVNSYESAVIKDKLIESGFIESDKSADILIINTCTVTNEADKKSLKMVRQARKNDNSIVIVCGCFSQINENEIDADIIIGNKNKSKIVDYINEFIKNKKKIVDIYDIKDIPFEKMELTNFDKTRAFIKIQDGCNNYCSYCIIPYSRGNVRSKSKEDIFSEVCNLIKDGHKEIVLTGIHTGHYGFDDYSLSDLLNDLCKFDLERIRISSIEITEITDELLSVIKNNKIIVDHMHIPLQSGSNEILKLMNRKYDKEYFINKIKRIRKIRPDISITTDVIVGFPNETDELFNETIETIKQINFSKIHVFPYSRRKGTIADTMDNQVDEKIQKERVLNLINLSKKLEINYMNKFINKKVSVLTEVYKDGYLIGHTGNYLLVKFLGNENLLHKDCNVNIESIEYPYCIGKFDNE